MFTGLRDVDRMILRKVSSEKDLSYALQVNKYSNSFFHDEKFWIERFFDRYGKCLHDEDVLKYKKGRLWRKYYYEVTKMILSCFPYFINAMYLDDPEERKRYDILKIQERLLKIKPVQKVYVDYGGSIEEEYFTRDGEIDGIREGMGTRQQIIDYDKQYMWFSLYRNGFTLNENYYENGRLKHYNEYHCHDDNSISKHVEYSAKKQVVLDEDISTDGTKFVRKFFVNGQPRASGVLLPNGKKHGKWIFYDKSGNQQLKIYKNDRKVKDI